MDGWFFTDWMLETMGNSHLKCGYSVESESEGLYRLRKNFLN